MSKVKVIEYTKLSIKSKMQKKLKNFSIFKNYKNTN